MNLELAPRYSYLVCSVRGGEPFPSTNRFWTLADLRKSVQREMRGMSCFWQVLVTDNGEQIGRGYRSGYNGTGNRWAWELPAEAPARSAAEALIEAGLARGGWAAQSARDLRDAIAAGRASELDSRITRLRRDLAS